MENDLSRRVFLGAAGVAAAAGTMTAAGAAGAQPATETRKIKILGVCGSARKGKTTATALRVALEAAKAVDPERIEIELIELAGRNINGLVAVGIPLPPGQKDDFLELEPKILDPAVRGMIVGSPVYFGDMSSLCKAFLERLMAFKKTLALSNRVGGALAVAGARNGGQEHTLRSIQAALFSQEMVVVGDGRPTCHYGATLWNNAKDDIMQDAPGLATAKDLGRRVAEVARLIAKT
jgi:multimeric flavodoxin WrbA